ncbi:aldo_ket_red domain-containing protein, partial [Haematococcus lacustris]
MEVNNSNIYCQQGDGGEGTWLKGRKRDSVVVLTKWPDRYVPLFGGPSYDPSQQRPDDVPFEEQLRGLEEVIKAGK